MQLHEITLCHLPRVGRPVLLVVASVLLLLAPSRARPQSGRAEPTTIESRPRTLLGGGGQVWSVAISPDGKFLAVGSGGSNAAGEDGSRNNAYVMKLPTK